MPKITHGRWKSKEWNSWDHMKRRCNNPKDPKYKDYGARGILVCKRWLIFENFYDDMGDAPSKSHSIDRVDNDGNYEPENCKWSTPKEQSNNRRKRQLKNQKMKKVVINKCFGGFGVSVAVLKELVLMNSDVIKAMPVSEYYGSDWKKRFAEDYPSRYKDIGDGYMGHDWAFNIYKDGMLFDLIDDYHNRDKLRSNKDLISVIEKLGGKANGSHARLNIVEIPDDVEFEIDEYDGMESIHEKHRSWR